jgi:hypothetical protein
MNKLKSLSNPHWKLSIDSGVAGGFGRLEAKINGNWVTVADSAADDGLFSEADLHGVVHTMRQIEHEDGTLSAEITRTSEERGLMAVQTVTIRPGELLVHRRHHYKFIKNWEGALHPGWRIPMDPATRYTLPMHAHEVPLEQVEPLRTDATWTLPVPMHFWHDRRHLVGYGVNKPGSQGTLDLHRSGDAVEARVYYPERCDHPLPDNEQLFKPAPPPTTIAFAAGRSLTIDDTLWVTQLAENQEPLFEAMRHTAQLIMQPARPPVPAVASAQRIADYFRNCGAWNPDALGPGRGWFTCLWTDTHTDGDASHRGNDHYHLGWGEGTAAESIPALVRHARRTGSKDLHRYVDEMSRNFELFQRRPGDAEPYFDHAQQQNGQLMLGDWFARGVARGVDPLQCRRIWTHSTGHTGYMMADLLLETPDWPNRQTLDHWRTLVGNLARYYARLQRPGGDLPDIVDDQDNEIHPSHRRRITARVVVAGLWTRWSQLSGDTTYLDRAKRLIDFVAPQIEHYEYFNQMVDTLNRMECSDSEAGCYALEGLVPYYEVTGDEAVGKLCRQAATWVIMWTYFYDLPKAHEGIARGGQCCRMPDYPLLYGIGPDKAMKPFLALHRLTGDPLYLQMAGEMAYFIARNLHHCPGKPWDGAAVHAIDQRTGRYWNGPEYTGMVDTGMSSGSALGALELWLARAACPNQ